MGAKTKVLMALVPAVAVLLLFWMALRPSHSSAVDDFSDLLLERRKVPDEKNLVVLLEETIDLLPDHARTSDWRLVTQNIHRGLWETNRIAAILRESEAARSHFWDELPGCQGAASEPADYFLIGVGVADRLLGGSLGSALTLEFMDSLREGRRSFCNGRVTALLRACETMLRADEGLDDPSVTYLLSLAVWPCESLLQSGGCSDAWLAEWAELLPQPETLRAVAVRALKADFVHFCKRVDDGTLRQGVMGEGRRAIPASTKDLVFVLRQHNYSTRYMKVRLAAAYREAISVVLANQIPEAFFDSKYDRSDELSKAWRPNSGSECVLGFLNLGEGAVKRYKDMEARVGLFRVIFACERHRRKYGTYPEDLDKLVPEFLGRVPVDPYLGVPLRYSRDREIVWAAGENLKDDGGSIFSEELGRDGWYRSVRQKYALDMVYPVSSNAFAKAEEQAREHLAK